MIERWLYSAYYRGSTKEEDYDPCNYFISHNSIYGRYVVAIKH